MADNTGIVWCDSTFNPWIGCTKVGPGCDNCYAEADFDLRRHRAKWGAGNPRSRTSVANWKKPLQWNKDGFYECPDCGLRGTAKEMGDDPKQCNHLRAAPARSRVFCASLADVFDNEVPTAWRMDLFSLIAQTPNLDWLILTKRIGNVEKHLREARDVVNFDKQRALWLWITEWYREGNPPSNVWLGATICTQPEADRDIIKLLATPARVRWLSMEPLLGPVDLTRHLYANALHRIDGGPRIDWVVVGGESGPHARPMHPDWARSLRDQCAAAGVPFLFKQWGEWVEYACGTDTFKGNEITLTNMGKVWPRSVNCYGGMVEGRVHMRRVGKKAAGRLLDGVLHDGYPEARP